MTPQQLRNSILQLAIQGKLVEQRSEEGTAEELYKQVQAEKKQLIKEGKIKKEKTLPEIEEKEIPFELPENWKWVRFGTLIRVIGGVSYKKNDVCKAGYRILRGGNVQDLKVILEEDDVFLPSTYADLEKQVRVGDCIIVASTGSKTVIGKAGYINREIPQTMIGAFLRICRPHLLECAEYIRTIFSSTYYRKHLRDLTKGTNINNVKESHITEMLVPLPPLAEQKRIVAKLEELMPLMDRYEEAWTKLEAFNARFPVDMQNSILQMAMEGKLVEQRPEEGTGEELYQQVQEEKKRLIKEGIIKKEKPLPEIEEKEIPYDIPETWRWVRIGSFASVLGGKRIPAGRTLTKENTGHVYIRVTDMKDGCVSTDDLHYVPEDIYPTISKYIINKEDIFITVAGTIGRVGKISAELDGANLTENADRLVFRLIDQNWLIKCMQSLVVQSQIAEATTKSSQPKLAIFRIQKMLIPLPPLAEQKRIVAKLEELYPLCERLKS